jgi:hypothetical protein
MRKDAVMIQFEVLSQHSPGWTRANHENLSQFNRCPGRYLNRNTSECMSRALLL